MAHTDTHTDTQSQNSMDKLAPHAHWFLRLALASVFIYHGISKFAGGLAVPPMIGLPSAVWGLVALAEVAGGILVLAGAFIKDRRGDLATRLGGLAIAPVMLGAIFMVHWPRWNFAPAPDQGFPMGGMEFQVVLLLISLYFIVRGNR